MIKKSTLCKKIHLTIILFFLAAASNSYACTPRGHIKFHNHTKIPITLTVFRYEDPSGDEHKKCVELARKMKKWPIILCPLKKIVSDIIIIEPGKTTSGICWVEREKSKGIFYFKKRVSHFNTSFKHNNRVVSGPGGIVDFQDFFLYFADYFTRVGEYTGDQSIITFSGCKLLSLICTVDFKMKKKTNSRSWKTHNMLYNVYLLGSFI